MYEKGIIRLAVYGLILVGSAITAAHAAPPWVNLVSFKSIEADPDKEYALTENHGPYLIMACSFSGRGADQQAQDLVIELRKRYKLPAFTYKKRFELAKAQGRGFDSFGDPVRMKYHAGDKIEEVAVLVGEFPSLEDSDAQKTLKKVKYLKPKCLEEADGDSNTQSLAGWREIQHNLYEAIGSEKKKKGPMGHAMIAPNPLLPLGYFNRKGLDPFLLDLNKDLEYSLLKCKGKYTVQVATFKGQVFIRPQDIEDVKNGKKKISNGLVEAANKATLLTQALRMKGYEAYEFHDRNASIVTVGSFNSVGTPLADGRLELNPKVHQIMQAFAAKPLKAQIIDQESEALTTLPQSLAGINFDIQPLPVEVPRASLGEQISHGSVERIDFRE